MYPNHSHFLEECIFKSAPKLFLVTLAPFGPSGALDGLRHEIVDKNNSADGLRHEKEDKNGSADGLGHEKDDKNGSADGLGHEIVDKDSSADGLGHEIVDKMMVPMVWCLAWHPRFMFSLRISNEFCVLAIQILVFATDF